jgi:tetratricopeptide (TPR) repeat protein
MTYVPPTPDELIDQLNLRDAADIDQALMKACDAELEAEDRPQDLQLAFHCVRAILMRHWENPDPAVQKHVASALLRRAQICAFERHIDRAREDFDEIWVRYKDSTDTEIRRIVVEGLLDAGEMEEKLGNKTTAEKWYGLTSHYEEDTDGRTLIQVVRAQANACDILIDRDWMDPAIEKIDAIRDRWSKHSEYLIRRRIANLLVAKGNGLIENEGRRAEAPQALDQALSYTEAALAPPVYFIQADARLGKCRAFLRLENYEGAIQVAEQAEEWAAQLEVRISEQEYAHVRRRFDLILLTKSRCLHALGRDEEALVTFDRCGTGLDDISDDPGETVATLKTLMTRVNILCALERWDDAEAFYSKIKDRVISFGIPKNIEVFAYVAMTGANINMARRSAGLPDPA